MKEALIILGDQLFPVKFYSPYKACDVFMAEDFGLCTHYNYHKHKLIFFLASMRTYADELKASGFKLHYEKMSEQSFTKRLRSFLVEKKSPKLKWVKWMTSFLKKN